MKRSSRHRANSIFLFVVSSCVALLFAELFLRIGGFSWPVLFGPDPVTGAFPRPNISFTYTDEGMGEVRTNSVGMRDREHSIAKPEGTYRIAVLGDSYAMALQVNQEQAFWAVLEERLNACRPFGAESEIEVLNFGVSGFGTAQELLTLRTRAWQYNPDLVLLAFTTGNDVRNNSRALENGRKRPFFELDENGMLVEDFRFLTDPAQIRFDSRSKFLLRKLSDYSRLLQLARRTSVLLARQTSPEDAEGESDNEAGLDDAIYRDNPGAEWDEAWQVTQALLVQMNTEVLEHGARFLVVTLSNGIQVHPDTRKTAEFNESRGITDIFSPDRRIQRGGQAGGYDVQILGPTLQRIARDNRTYLHGFDGALGIGHWNADGHRYAGELISDYLCVTSTVDVGAAQ